MEKIKVVVIDDNASLVGLLVEFFENNKKIEIVYEAYNGTDGVKYIEKHQNNIDVVLLDLIMPKRDGLWVLSQLKQKKVNIKTIVETSYSTPEIIREVAEAGANYFIAKPFELKDLEKRIIDIIKYEGKEPKVINIDQSNLEIEITKILHELGIPSHIKGYQYIRDSIILIYEKNEYIGGITKELYPEIAKKYKTTVSRVERAIRHAIEVSCNRVECEVLHDYFGYSLSYEKSKPTNSEFLVTIADRIKMESKKIGQF